MFWGLSDTILYVHAVPICMYVIKFGYILINSHADLNIKPAERILKGRPKQTLHNVQNDYMHSMFHQICPNQTKPDHTHRPVTSYKGTTEELTQGKTAQKG